MARRSVGRKTKSCLGGDCFFADNGDGVFRQSGALERDDGSPIPTLFAYLPPFAHATKPQTTSAEDRLQQPLASFRMRRASPCGPPGVTRACSSAEAGRKVLLTLSR
ncbi:unnamed protein product [Larinioides sclopetarius]|uniref:Uncharacterized protein n=1 Tax=Larinioides sclopetarius TaxID=280406 RepID=A0AAV2BVH9_9ARAC